MAGVGSPGRVYTRTNSFSEDALEGGGVAIIDTKGGKGSKWDWIQCVEVCSRNGLKEFSSYSGFPDASRVSSM